MNTRPRCLNCKTNLNERSDIGLKSYLCVDCHSGLIPTVLLAKIISDYEFNKLNYEIQKSQIISSLCCPLCDKRMIKILDLLQVIQVDCCDACKVTWIKASDWEKIKKDRTNFNKRPQTLSLNSNKESNESEFLNNSEEGLDCLLDLFFFDDF